MRRILDRAVRWALLALPLACGSGGETGDAGAAAPETAPDAAVGQGAPKARKPAGAHTYRKDYRFTTDWHSNAIPTWERVLAPYVGRPELRYLEAGVFEGRSLLWVLENVATHPTSRLTGIDIKTWYARDNIELSGEAHRIEMLEGRSQVVLRTLPLDAFDIIYIDGSHRGDDVLADAVLSWPLLKVGGTLIFDDYSWNSKVTFMSQLVLPPELRPKEAIDVFLTLFRDQLEVVHRMHQLTVRKKEPLCTEEIAYCSPVGRYVYHWVKKEVRDPASGEPVELTETERALLEQLLSGIGFGETRVSPPEADGSRTDPDLSSLVEKLGL